MIKRIITLGLTVLLIGCASGPKPTSYILGADVGMVQSAEVPFGISRIGIDAVRLPTYAQSKKIPFLNSDNTIVVEDNHLWAEPVEETIHRHIAKQLREATGIEVIASPYPRGMSADGRVQIRFDEFIRTPNGAKLSGQYIITDGRGREVVKVKQFDFSQVISPNDYNSFIDAVNLAMIKLAEDISNNIGIVRDT